MSHFHPIRFRWSDNLIQCASIHPQGLNSLATICLGAAQHVAGRVETISLQQNIEYFLQPSFGNIFQCCQGCALFPAPPTSAPHVQLPGLKVKLLSKITNLFFFEDLLQRWSRVGPRLPPLPPLKLCSTDYCASRWTCPAPRLSCFSPDW